MADSQNPNASSDPASATSKSNTSTIRLAVLLVLLGISIGMVVADHFVFQPAVKIASEALTHAIDEHNKRSIEAAGDTPFTTPEMVQKIIGFKPTREELVGKYRVEYYCWWGSLPVPRQFIAVGYYKRQDGKWVHIKHDVNRKITEDELPLSDEKAMEMAKKQIEKTGHGPDRQMPVPELSAPPGTAEPTPPATEKTDPAPTDPAPSAPATTEPAPSEPNASKPSAEDESSESK
jgi:hypothetical protein